MHKIILGTRGSELAKTQSLAVARLLEAQGLDVELKIIQTKGDISTRSLVELGGIGVFAAALRTALLHKECDIAVHSFKDLPTAAILGLAIGAVPAGAAPSDVLCARDSLSLAELPKNSLIGTGSPRRAAQIRAIRPDLQIVNIRGNIDTRLARIKASGATDKVSGIGTARGTDTVDGIDVAGRAKSTSDANVAGKGNARLRGDLDGVILAKAGLERLQRCAAITEELDIFPAPAQGRLAVECRSEDAPWNSESALAQALAKINDNAARAAAFAERAVLAGLNAGCAAPVGVKIVDSQLADSQLVAGVFSLDGKERCCAAEKFSSREYATFSPYEIPQIDAQAAALGQRVAAQLLAQGAGEIANLQAVKARGSGSD
ncbi:MAG: hydroxymethylbilane synthase [Actinomycetaceae bacterium]|nr:hydroxymethylbilane synthase [Actinomycetaceae bacterium]